MEFPLVMTQTKPIDNIRGFIASRLESFYRSLRAGGIDLPNASVLRNSARILGDAKLALAYDPEEDPEISESDMTCTFTITTPRKDRYGDVVIPRGCEPSVQNYLRNPQVFFSHHSWDKPIANAVRLEISEDRIVSAAKFHEETEEARVIWRLLAKKFLRATSIGFLPVKAAVIGSDKSEAEQEEEWLKQRKERTETGEKVINFDPWFPLRFLEWELLEYSVVPVPANPDCVDGLSKYLSDGEIEGEKFTPGLRKALESFTLKAKVWSPGFDPRKVKYSGVLMLDQTELEYKEGDLTRVGDKLLADDDITPVPVSEPAVTILPAADTTPSKSKDVESPIPEESLVTSIDDLYKCVEGIHAELTRHHAIEETELIRHNADEEVILSGMAQQLAEMVSLLKEMLGCMGKPPEPVPAPKQGSIPPTAPHENWSEVLKILDQVATRQAGMAQKFYSITGSKV